jgi:ABC-2 type transport system ATP-binding protein
MLNIAIKKIYYQNKIIIKDVNVNLSKPGIYGFFGKNGSGKTTFLKSFTKTVSYEGEIQLNNHLLSEKKVAWIPTEPFLYEYLTIKEFYDFFSFTTRELSPLNEMIFEVDDSKLLKECSTGTRKKAFINAVFQFTDYDIYIFDEPFNGLDIESNYILLLTFN